MPVTLSVTKTAIVVNSDPLWGQGGDVDTWCDLVGIEIRRLARLYCPPNTHAGQSQYFALRDSQSTGILHASIYGETQRIGRRNIEIEVGARAPHAKYVLNGTGAQGRNFIYTREGYYNRNVVNAYIKGSQFEFGRGEKGLVMWLPPAPQFKNHLYLRVRGQPANPFLTDAYSRAAEKHSSLPRKRFARSLN